MGFDREHDPTVLPTDLPIPVDDGAAAHLLGASVSRVPLLSTSGRWVNLGFLTKPAVLFFYPRTGVPGRPPGRGYAGEEWDAIPGARGCTPQSCGFRDLHAEFAALGVEVFGVSTSTSEHQREFVARTGMPFEMLSDAELALTRAMRLPTFEFPVEGGVSSGPTTMIRRMAWSVAASPGVQPRIEHVWYPVFPPDRNASQILAWLRARREGGAGSDGGSGAAKSTGAPTGTGTVHVAAAVENDAAFVREQLERHWLSTTIWSRDKRFEADRISGLVARVRGARAGLLTYVISPAGPSGGASGAADELEVITLSSAHESEGIGSALLAAAEAIGRARRCRRVFLTTSNDNLRALRFYQRRGYRLVAVYPGMMDRYRERQPAIPRVGMNGIPLHDEIELEKLLDS
ncbi:MAG: GNAT family N-acetyltransferase [Phycisphaerales bacterium]